MNLQIQSIEFSRDLLFSMAGRYPTVVNAGSQAKYEIRFIPDVTGLIEVQCIISTNMGTLYYKVFLVGSCDL